MGSVSDSLPLPLANTSASLQSSSTSNEMAVVPKHKKATLRSVINIVDFEVAASQLMDLKSFTCKLLHDTVYGHVVDYLNSL